MKRSLKTQFLPPALIAALGAMLAGRVTAQTFTTLHNFAATSSSLPYTNSDGVGPTISVLSSNTLYGTAGYGGSSGNGTVFAIHTVTNPISGAQQFFRLSQ